ncbi:MAG: hypothetical protein IJ682_05590 [Lachnospiraceae bacterium]|nr:hypothetical protein [Lachnospiraceae bacterium]
MSTVYLHIGTAKTGTTAIQRFLPMNREILNRWDYDHPLMPFHFPRMGDGRNAHFLTLWNDDSKWAKRWDKGFAVIKEAAERFGHIIMSDEVLWAAGAQDGFWERVTDGFSRTGVELVIVVYLRRQDEMAESHWNQMVKGKPKLSQGFSEFVTAGEYEASFPLEYDKGLDRIASFVGKDNIIVRAYEAGQFIEGSLFADFLDAVGLSLTDEYAFPEHVVNTRLPENVVEIKRLINTVDSYKDAEVPNYFREVIRQAYGLEMLNEIPKHKVGRFSAEERRSFMERFEPGNAYVAREYLHRATGRLFEEEPKPLPKYEPDEKELMRDAVRVLAGASVYEYRKWRELEAQVLKLNEQMDALERRAAEQSSQMKKLKKQMDEMFNSAPFRALRKLKKSKEDDAD